ncbi:hypothetical protein [Dongshaea marina]|nr:hypothetical protein [Dongshaea marina]
MILFVIGIARSAYLRMKGMDKNIPEYKSKMHPTDDEDDDW